MADILAQIVANKRIELDAARSRVSLDQMSQRAADAPEPRNFFAALTRPVGTLRVIAEVKRASPSAGLIRTHFDPIAIARAYHDNGAAAISCLTDETFFHGSLGTIAAIKEAVPLAVLRKDFIIDPYQVYESRVAGADAILLIAECLPDEREFVDLLHLAKRLKMTVLVEVHDVVNLRRVRPHLVGHTLLGINNRDLKAMTTDVAHTLGLLDRVDDKGILVSESGIRTPEDVTRLRRAGVHRILVGEHLMRQDDIGAALRELVHAPGSDSAG